MADSTVGRGNHRGYGARWAALTTSLVTFTDGKPSNLEVRVEDFASEDPVVHLRNLMTDGRAVDGFLWSTQTNFDTIGDIRAGFER